MDQKTLTVMNVCPGLWLKRVSGNLLCFWTGDCIFFLFFFCFSPPLDGSGDLFVNPVGSVDVKESTVLKDLESMI